MSVTHCVVVWEWWESSAGCWLPHPPSVAQQLERAHGKRLTRVVLGDADPALAGHHVNLRTQTQTQDSHDGSPAAECGVRRACYSVWSPAGRGARWEWARAPPARHAPDPSPHLQWEQLSMEMQCRLEEAWTRGEACVEVAAAGGAALVQLATLTARAPGGARVVRRVTQAPYPLTRAPAPPSAASAASAAAATTNTNTVQGRRMQSAPQQAGGARPGGGAPAVDRQRTSPKHNLARQILHNLNIFSTKPTTLPIPCTSPPPEEFRPDGKRDTDSTTSTRSGRRPSQDTVSTYLSHETCDAGNQPALGDLLNCSVGSDDVFEQAPCSPPLSPPLSPPARPKTPSSTGSIVGVDEASSSVSVYVRVVERVQWGAVCPLCLRGLEHGAGGSGTARVVVALTHCQHMMHLQCLNLSLTQQRNSKGTLFIECGVCGVVYGGGGGGCEEPAETERGGGGGGGGGGGSVQAGGGDQPAGSMAWCVQHRPLPNHPAHTNTIQITFNMISGTQGPEHPSPGCPYYAVGFPRYCYLPDTPLGRRVLNLLCVAWERRLLFTIGRSQTTGREDVVAWAHGLRLRAERAQYAAGAADAAAHLTALRRRLAALVASVDTNLYQELQ